MQSRRVSRAEQRSRTLVPQTFYTKQARLAAALMKKIFSKIRSNNFYSRAVSRRARANPRLTRRLTFKCKFYEEVITQEPTRSAVIYNAATGEC
ncbi:hypothetical protein EVAR_35961_1 [Eumeta japonica]|uniref:Uncharacterized protein n=1 Tax=Eumeta variegata TaxID=151549 RepID=A0A4C1W5A8_EUMVA|nr:hypothetical protein EVAR_35961_1 [Eumeta japonica]